MDEAKNNALLFFVDHLMQKNGVRTIHDLSCQFGARGFTDEMRQAVGGTQESLSEFLGQFPSMFTLDGDKVVLKGFGDQLDGAGADGQSNILAGQPNFRERNYVAEAIQFFTLKLEKFGPELQIKSLLGHRSQAAPEIRLISGRHLKEFAEFLSAQTNDFVVEGDRVRLKNIVESKESIEVGDDGLPLTGARAKKAAIDYLKGLLEQNDEAAIPLDVFYKKFCERFPHSVRQDVATNPKELLLFLKLNRHIFFIRSNKVSLVRNRTGDENGSESGHSTTGSVATSGFEGARGGEGSRTLSNISPSAGGGLFPLTRDNIPLINLVKDVRTAEGVVRDFLTELEGQPQAERFVALDFKVIHLDVEILPSMIIMASNAKLACFDMAHSDGILLESGLKELIFESPTITKVIHGVKAINGLLAQRYSVQLQNVFDTQVAHAVIQHERFGKPFSELRDISFLNLQRIYHPESLMLSDIIVRKLSQSQSWGQRPITDELLLSACEECHSLATALYRIVAAQLPATSQPLFEGKCLEALSTTPQQGFLPKSENGRFFATAPSPPTAQNNVNRNAQHQFFQQPPKIQNNNNFANNNRGFPPSSQQNPWGQPALSQGATPKSGYFPSPPPQNHHFPGNSVPPSVSQLSGTNNANGGGMVKVQHVPVIMKPPPKKLVSVGTQTVSTGEITAHKTFNEDGQQDPENGGN